MRGDVVLVLFVFYGNGDPRDLHGRTHSFPTRRSSDLAPVVSVDGRLSKMLRWGRATMNIDFDLFNILNMSTVLSREYDLRLTSGNEVLEIMNQIGRAHV